MKLYYTPPGETQVALHELGDIYIAGQSSDFTPTDLPQREIRTLTVRIEFLADTYQDNYSLLTQVSAALKKTNGILKWQEEDTIDESDQRIAGTLYLNQTVRVIAQDIPETPNSWGTTQQIITLQFQYDLNDRASASIHLSATFQKHGAGAALTLGHVYSFKDDFKTQWYSAFQHARERSTGTVSMNGELLPSPAATPTVRRAALLSDLDDLRTQMEGQDGVLQYGPSGSVFNRTVKIESFSAEVNQATDVIRWSLTGNYTLWPEEEGYAAADVKCSVQEDKENGESILSISGDIGAQTEALALSKLAVVRTAMLASAGFASAQNIRSDVDKQYVNAADTQEDAGPNMFLKLTFSETYRKRLAGITSYNLTITDADDATGGVLTRTYAGSVVASGATETAAYQAALAQAMTLGDNKHPFRVSGNASRVDRKVGSASREHVRLEFNYVYRLKGTRIYLEVSTETAQDTFGDDTERVNGYVVAETEAKALQAYTDNIRTAYNGRLIRGETKSYGKAMVGKGTYAASGFTAAAGVETLISRMDFSFTAFKVKATGSYAIKYGMSVEVDYTRLQKSVTVQGRFVADPTLIAAAEAGTVGNKLDVFLTALGLGNAVSTTRRSDREQVGNTSPTVLSLEFSQSYLSRVSTAYQVLACEVSERIQYTGTRWMFQPTPDGVSVAQNCGTQHGRRTMTGTVHAATEDAAMTYVRKLHKLSGGLWNTFPSGNGGGTLPATRYEDPPEIERSWESVPLTEMTDRGTVATICRVNFTFAETLLSFPYVET